MIAQCRGPEKKMGFVNIIAAMIIQRNIITRQVHSQGNVCVVTRIIIHQRHKKPGYIHQSKQEKKKKIDPV